MSGNERERVSDKLNLVWQVPLAFIFGISENSEDEPKRKSNRRPFELDRALHNLRVRLFVSREDRDDADNALDLALTGSYQLSEADRKRLEDKTFR